MPAIEREALAITDALKAYKYYIHQNSVEFLSDHKPLVWLVGFKDEDSSLGRWAMKQSPYDYKIIYRPGKENGPALSRLSVNVITERSIDIENMQANDPLCIKIRRYLEEGILDDEGSSQMPLRVKEIDLFTISDGLLFRIDSINSRKNHPRHQLVAPLALRRKILADAHTFIRSCGLLHNIQ